MNEKLSFVINVSSFTSGSVFCCLWNLFLFRETFPVFFFFSSSIQLWFLYFLDTAEKCRAEIMQSEVNFRFYLMAIFLIFYTIFLYGVKLLPHCRFFFLFLSMNPKKMVLKFLKCHLILNFFMLLCTFHGIKMKKKWSALQEKKKLRAAYFFILSVFVQIRDEE